MSVWADPAPDSRYAAVDGVPVHYKRAGRGPAVKRTILRGARVMIPGLVNAHQHTWQTALRAIGADWTLMGYLTRLHGGAGRHFTPDDLRIAALAEALNQINSGTTTLGDWCHNALTPDHADAAIQGLTEAGIRAVFLHGTPVTGALLALGTAPSLGTDVATVVPGQLLTAARIALAHQRGLAHDRSLRSTGLVSADPPVTGKQALSWATIEGARALGLADQIG